MVGEQNSVASVAALCGLWRSDLGTGDNADYSLLAEMNGAYAARSRKGQPALVIPLKDLGSTPIGRRASGCELIGHPSTRLVFEGRDEVSCAAALLCVDSDLVDVFAVLAVDIAKRVKDGGCTWSSVMTAVEEWQTLLTPRGRPTPENEAGLWGELWFLSQADEIETALAAWCGPEGDATDFFLGGKSAEVKTSRFRRRHHVSLSQVETPVGTHEAWLLSIWVKQDPTASSTVAKLADAILERVQDRGEGLRRLARAGYSPADRAEFTWVRIFWRHGIVV